MPVRIVKKPKNFVGGLPYADITKTVYPFAIKQKITSVKNMISTNYPGDNMGYIYFNNCSSLESVLYCQQTVVDTDMYLNLIIRVWDTNSISPIIDIIKFNTIKISPRSSESLRPQNFIVNNNFSNVSKNNTVGLFIYAYNELKSDLNSFDLGYLEKKS